jgi:phosphatidylglycerol:prolipoprotein diacylglycerol transferase
MLSFPNIDPVAVSLGPFDIRWYSLAYIVGLVLGALYIDRINKKFAHIKNVSAFDDLMVWGVLGVLLGGRFGYIFFYHPGYYFSHPLEIFKVWEGGMSFHGGLIGVTVAIYLFCRKHKVQFWKLIDLCAAAAPLGLFFGRVANFINGELYGRSTDVAWAVIFPTGGDVPRHPSQLYEAALEGIVSFFILYYLIYHRKTLSKPGMLTGAFLLCYSTSRIIVEFFREPDVHIGFIANSLTMGQLLSVPMLLLGMVLIIVAKPHGK